MTLTNKGYCFNINEINDDILKDLTIEPKINESYTNNKIIFHLYKIIDDNIYVPRFYGINKLLKDNELKYDLIEKKTRFIFTKELRDKQTEIVDISVNHLQKYGGGILALCCGSGKTIMALKIAEILGLKTLVIVHKSFLQDQWCKRISEFTNARVGIIRQKKIDIENKDIVIGMLQSISMIGYDDAIFKDFGLCIVDECHHIGSRIFSNTFFKVNCRYMLGLSATPQRTDGTTQILHMFLGDIIYSLTKKNIDKVCVEIFHYKSKNKKYIEKLIMSNGKKIPAISTMITNLTEIRERNIFLYDIINALRKTRERKILILSGRTSLLECLKKNIDKKISEEENNGILEKDEIRTYYYIGKLNQKERLEAEKYADILFATYEMAHEGLDIDRLNTVILATPKSNITQSIGRIMRKENSDGLPPLIIDIVDDLSLFPIQGNKRKFIYQDNNYNICNRYTIDNNIVSKKQYYADKYQNSDDDEIDDNNVITHIDDIFTVED